MFPSVSPLSDEFTDQELLPSVSPLSDEFTDQKSLPSVSPLSDEFTKQQLLPSVSPLSDVFTNQQLLPGVSPLSDEFTDQQLLPCVSPLSNEFTDESRCLTAVEDLQHFLKTARAVGHLNNSVSSYCQTRVHYCQHWGAFSHLPLPVQFAKLHRIARQNVSAALSALQGSTHASSKQGTPGNSYFRKDACS